MPGVVLRERPAKISTTHKFSSDAVAGMHIHEADKAMPGGHVARRRGVRAVRLKIGHLAPPSVVALFPSSRRPRASPGLCMVKYIVNVLWPIARRTNLPAENGDRRWLGPPVVRRGRCVAVVYN